MHQVKTRLNLFIKRLIVLSIFLWSIAIAYGQQNIRDSLKKEIKKIEKNKNFSVKDTTYINLLNSLSYEQRFFNRDSILLLSHKTLEHSRSINYKEGEIESLLNIAEYYYDNGDYAQAINTYKSALIIAHEVNNSKLILDVENSLGLTYDDQGNSANALKTYLKALKLASEIDDKNMLSVINENIANLYASQKDYKQALFYYKKVTILNKEIGDDSFAAETKANIADIYTDIGEYDKAMVNINESIAIFAKHKVIDWLAFAYRVKGGVYLKQKKYKWALNWYEKSEILHRKLNDNRSKIYLFNGIAAAYLGLKKNKLSEQYALSSYKIATEINTAMGIMDCAEILYKINKDKGDYPTALKYHERFQQISNSLFKDDEKKSLAMHKAKIAYEKQEETLILKNKKALDEKQNYINAALVISLISILIIILIFRSRSIQKRLNVKLEKQKSILINREVQLNESNETKNMLFSIIGHDLRGPIGALKGLLLLFKNGEIKKAEFTDMIPKLTDDVNHIFFTLNNLLSWSQTQMNGSKTKLCKVSLKSLVEENTNLLSEIAENKSISIVNTLDDNISIWADYDQINVVVRNLISNALKFTPNNGTITISTKENDNNWLVAVKDTGVGMNKELQEKIFNKNINISTYGTDNEKGTGIGLSLCREMIKKNEGSLWVESNLGKGSTFYFTLPKAK